MQRFCNHKRRNNQFSGLQQCGLTPDGIHKVVTTHADPDHYGNSNCFASAEHYWWHYVIKGELHTKTTLETVEKSHF